LHFLLRFTAGAQTRFDAEAVRLNNRGVAQMSQQATERAAASFAEAFNKDPRLAQAAINEGIALMAQQKLDEAKEGLAGSARFGPRQRAGVVQPGPCAARGQ
jgi:tetratricopeptide (TPR) repeat protein